MVALAGILVALLAVLLVLEPVLRAARGESVVAGESLFTEGDEDDDPAATSKGRALAALREIEFDRATGKLSDEDYQNLHEKYSAEAMAVLKSEDRGPGTGDRQDDRSPVPGPRSPDAVEALIGSARAAAPPAGARFCEECGTPLEGRRRFCVECGHQAVIVAR